MEARRTLFVLAVLLFALCGIARAGQAKQPAAMEPNPLSTPFVRAAGRAFTTIKQAVGLVLSSKGPTPADDRIGEAENVASTAGDKAFLLALKDYKDQKTIFNVEYNLAHLEAETSALNGSKGPEWRCAPLEDRDTCPSFQAAIAAILAANRDLAKDRDDIEDCEDSLAAALKAGKFASAPACRRHLASPRSAP